MSVSQPIRVVSPTDRDHGFNTLNPPDGGTASANCGEHAVNTGRHLIHSWRNLKETYRWWRVEPRQRDINTWLFYSRSSTLRVMNPKNLLSWIHYRSFHSFHIHPSCSSSLLSWTWPWPSLIQPKCSKLIKKLNACFMLTLGRHRLFRPVWPMDLFREVKSRGLKPDLVHGQCTALSLCPVGNLPALALSFPLAVIVWSIAPVELSRLFWNSSSSTATKGGTDVTGWHRSRGGISVILQAKQSDGVETVWWPLVLLRFTSFNQSCYRTKQMIWVKRTLTQPQSICLIEVVCD